MVNEKYNNFELYIKHEYLLWFCGQYLFTTFINIEMVIDIKNISYKNPYLYVNEHKSFEQIENLWQSGEYIDVLQKCRNLLLYFITQYNGQSFSDNKKKQEIEEFTKTIIKKLQIENLDKEILNILTSFKTIRDKLGKGEPGSQNNQEWLIKFKNSPVLNQKIYTRILIDQLKNLHNIFILLKNEDNKIEEKMVTNETYQLSN